MKRLSFKPVLSLVVVAGLLSVPSGAWAAMTYSASELNALRASDEVKIRDIQIQEINQLRIALGRRLPTRRRADLYYRLAEIYAEAYHAEFVLEGRVHEKHIEGGQKEK